MKPPTSIFFVRGGVGVLGGKIGSALLSPPVYSILNQRERERETPPPTHTHTKRKWDLH